MAMNGISPLLLVINIILVIIVTFLVNRILRASSKFNWNPGDGEIQGKQKFIILRSLIAVAVVALAAVLINAFFG